MYEQSFHGLMEPVPALVGRKQGENQNFVFSLDLLEGGLAKIVK